MNKIRSNIIIEIYFTWEGRNILKGEIISSKYFIGYKLKRPDIWKELACLILGWFNAACYWVCIM